MHRLLDENAVAGIYKLYTVYRGVPPVYPQKYSLQITYGIMSNLRQIQIRHSEVNEIFIAELKEKNG